MTINTRNRTVLRSTNEVMERHPIRNVGTHFSCPYCAGTYPQMRVTNQGRLMLTEALRKELVTPRCSYCGGVWRVER